MVHRDLLLGHGTPDSLGDPGETSSLLNDSRAPAWEGWQGESRGPRRLKELSEKISCAMWKDGGESQNGGLDLADS